MTNINLTESIIQGDCLDVLKTMEDNSVDSVVTDPPYGLSKEPDINEVLSKWLAGEAYDHGHGGFMGKSWDSFVPHPDIWAEVYRVLKPGGHALVFAGTRTQDLMTISLRLSGFEVRDVIEWLYFSGFPKSHNVSKAFDRRAGDDRWEDKKKLAAHIRECRLKANISLKEMNNLFGYVAGCNWWESTNKNTNRVPNEEDWEILKKDFGCSSEYDWLIGFVKEGLKGEKIGEAIRGNAGFSSEQVPRPWKKKVGESYDITAPATELARKWDGWGTALKPAHEPIIVVRKPLIDADTGRKLTVADCVEKYGTGAINIDASRIATDDSLDRPQGETSYMADNTTSTGYTRNPRSYVMGDYVGSEKGRFPANCITLDSDEFYSKYFNVAQANVSPQELSKKASKKDRNSDWQGEVIEGNVHPTVKPTDLMAWLVRLVTPEGGTVLDPFAGSGSTLVAAKREGFGFVGVELTEEYIPIIEARVGVEAEGKAKE